IRIAVTGAGIICSIGRNKEEVWRSIPEARAGIGKLSRFPGETFPTHIAAEVESDIGPPLPIRKRDAPRMSRSARLAVLAAAGAVTQAGATARARTVVSTGPSTGGLLEGEEYYFARVTRGRDRARASRVLQQPTSGPSDAVARALALGGGVFSNATAC